MIYVHKTNSKLMDTLFEFLIPSNLTEILIHIYVRICVVNPRGGQNFSNGKLSKIKYNGKKLN